MYLWHDADRVRPCPSGYGHLATCDETDPKKQPPISHEKCPKVHDMWVKSVAAHPPFPGIFSCHLVSYKLSKLIKLIKLKLDQLRHLFRSGFEI